MAGNSKPKASIKHCPKKKKNGSYLPCYSVLSRVSFGIVQFKDQWLGTWKWGPDTRLLRWSARSERRWQDRSNQQRTEQAAIGYRRPCTLNAVKQMGRGWDVAQLVRASDRHAADAGSIPRCGKGFSSPSQLSVQTLFLVPVPLPVCKRMH